MPVPAKVRVAACVSKRHHVEQLTLVAITLVISTLLELHDYSALGIFSVLAIGCRDMLLILLFAEEDL